MRLQTVRVFAFKRVIRASVSSICERVASMQSFRSSVLGRHGCPLESCDSLSSSCFTSLLKDENKCRGLGSLGIFCQKGILKEKLREGQRRDLELLNLDDVDSLCPTYLCNISVVITPMLKCIHRSMSPGVLVQ